MAKEKDLSQQILEFLYLHPHSWFNDEKLSVRFNTTVKETLSKHLTQLTQDKLVHRKEYFTIEKPITFLHYTYRISGEGKNKIEDRRYKKKLQRNSIIGISITITIGLISILLKYYEQREPSHFRDSIENVPAILEDSFSNETNTLIDTLSGNSTKDSNQIAPKKDDL